MAQQRKAEDTGLKLPETPSLCTPPIPTTKSPPKLAKQAADSSGFPDRKPSDDSVNEPDESDRRDGKAEAGRDDSKKRKRGREVNRCLGCGRKVGLIGFRCRCGGLFCSQHRYSDRHGCSFDYKAAAREAIVRQNPVVRAAKIVKI